MSARALLCLFLTGLLGLSGCLQVPDDDGDGDDPDGPGAGGETKADGSQTGHDDDPPPDDDNKTDDGDDENETADEERACWQYRPRHSVPPQEQEVETADDIRCPGQFAVTAQGSGDAWEVPVWTVGDWWRYEIRAITGGTRCDVEEETVTNASQSRHELPVYTTSWEREACSWGDDRNGTRERVQDSLMPIEPDGYIDHWMLFPLRDGKQWRFMSADELMMDAEVSYDGLLGVWEVVLHGEQDGFGIEIEQTWDPEVKNVKHMLISTSMFVIEQKLMDSSYGDGGVA